MRVLIKSERASWVTFSFAKIVKFEAAGWYSYKFKMKWCYARSRISQKWLVPFHAESLSFREYRDRSTVSVSSNFQDVFLSPTRLFSTFSPFLIFDPLIVRRSLRGSTSSHGRINNTRTLVFLERKKKERGFGIAVSRRARRSGISAVSQMVRLWEIDN